jgi:A/G-specific adenine glycosylase
MLIIKKNLTKWYKTHHRNLPWRNTKNPYRIWLSEVILQQTRVDQGLNYYEKFTAKYPTIQSLAATSENEVLKDWEGLGYYSRARNLLYTANFICEKLQGKFPTSYNEIIKLKGIGPYAAAAISSFAFEEERAVVDGNVYRTLSRIFGISTPIDSTTGKKEFQALADELIKDQIPSIHNQAMMEFGALQCTPKNPDCENCPFKDNCFAFKHDLISDLPVKSKKTKQTKRYFTYLVVSDGEHLMLNKRSEKGIWANLFEFPVIESTNENEQIAIQQTETWNTLVNETNGIVQFKSNIYKHILSHQIISAVFFEIKLSEMPLITNMENLIINKSELNQYALPKLLVNYLSDRDDLLSLLNDN